MGRTTLKVTPLQDASFGVMAELATDGPDAAIALFHDQGAALIERFHAAGGLMVVRGLSGLAARPQAFVALSYLFGPEVETVRETLTAARFFHPDHSQIMRLANTPPCDHPPPPRAPRAPGGGLEVRHPHQTNWHTDQSYRRPPPDVTLLYAVTTPPADQGQTLFADCTAALAALPPDRRDWLSGMTGIHAAGWIGRRPEDVQDGVVPRALLPHQLPQKQPLVRPHPVTGRPALYLCQSRQMDYVDGPIAELAPGPGGPGAALIEELLCHITQPAFVYAHHWQPGDLVIADNRCLLHAATWFDADTHAREMWRTTVMGNPGPAYAGEAKSWIPRDGHAPMQGMEDA